MRIPLSFAIPVLLLAACSSPTSSGPGTVSQNMTVDQSTSVGSTAVIWGSSPVIDLAKNRKVTIDLSGVTGKHVHYMFTDVSANRLGQPQYQRNGRVSGRTSHPTRRISASSRSEASVSARPQRLEYLPDDEFDHTPPPRLLGRVPARSFQAPTVSYTAMTVADSGDSDHLLRLRKQFRGSVETAVPEQLGRFRPLSQHLGSQRLLEFGDGDCSPVAADSVLHSRSPRKISAASTSAALSVNSVMVQALADRFLSDGVNDVYAWDTSIYWSGNGPKPAPTRRDLIDGHGEINIFISNLNPGGFANGILEGYFDSTNNYS